MIQAKFFRWALCLLSFCGLLCLIVWDSRQHFDADLIEQKKNAYSAQKNWNVHYGQSNVYLSGGIRHDDDFKRIVPLIEPATALITDVATSYYAAASLPLYVKNVHRHHGRSKSPEWERLISHRITCYLDNPEYMGDFNKVLAAQAAGKRALPPVVYIAVNRTHYNVNFKRGCMSQRRRGLLSVIDQLGQPVFEGDTITVYGLSAASSKSD